MRKIIHVDMDAFYASIEENENPELKGKPLIISGPPNSRSVVCTCNYIARRYGVHSAMPASQALKLCPNGIFKLPRMALYKDISRIIHKVFNEITDLIEPLSLDEAYLDVTDQTIDVTATELAKNIKKMIFQKTNLTCSAGVSYNKLLAKIASDWEKPNGLTVIPPSKAQDFISELPVNKIYGIGEKTYKKMQQLGISTGRDLYEWPKYRLLLEFGKSGEYFYNAARGIDNRPVRNEYEAKSVSRETTFNKDVFSEREARETLSKLLDSLIIEIQKNKYCPKILQLKIRYSNFETKTKVIGDFKGNIEKHEMLIALENTLKSFNWKSRGLRLVGITFSKLIDSKDKEQLNLLF